MNAVRKRVEDGSMVADGEAMKPWREQMVSQYWTALARSLSGGSSELARVGALDNFGDGKELVNVAAGHRKQNKMKMKQKQNENESKKEMIMKAKTK
jgi:hypothetical protein